MPADYLTLYKINEQQPKWSVGPKFIGQASYDGETIFGLQSDALVALDKHGNRLWQWDLNKKNDSLKEFMITTKTHVFVVSHTEIFVISKSTHKVDFHGGVSGTISISMGHLYVHNKDGYVYSYSLG